MLPYSPSGWNGLHTAICRKSHIDNKYFRFLYAWSRIGRLPPHNKKRIRERFDHFSPPYGTGYWNRESLSDNCMKSVFNYGECGIFPVLAATRIMRTLLSGSVAWKVNMRHPSQFISGKFIDVLNPKVSVFLHEGIYLRDMFMVVGWDMIKPSPDPLLIA